MMKRVLVPVAALLAAAVLGGVSAVGLWEAIDEEPAAVSAGPASVGTPVASGGMSVNEIYERTSPAIVQITAESSGPFGSGESTGSGFVIDGDGRVVTNQHVVGEAETVTVRFEDGEEVDARVVGTDPSTDVALLELEDAVDVEPLEWGSSQELEIGDPVVAVGSPFGLQGTVTTGIVSALDRQLRAPDGFTIDGAIQTDAALNQGNSGGPLLDAEGRVVGMNSQIASESGGNDGIGYAIPSETIQSIVEQLQADGEVQHAFLGVSIEDSEDPAGARIARVANGSPADDAGLRVGDVVVLLDGEEVANADDLRLGVSAKQPGDEIELEVERDGEAERITVELGTRPSTAA